MQIRHSQALPVSSVLLSIVPVIIAAFAYPMGNRKMMQLIEGRLDVYQRILGMLLGSLPFWLLLSGYEVIVNHKMPQSSQYLQTFIVAVCSGVIATVLFFYATDKVSTDNNALAAVEATQSAEVIFTLAGEIWLLNTAYPDSYAVIGMALIIIGMVLHSMWGNKICH